MKYTKPTTLPDGTIAYPTKSGSTFYKLPNPQYDWERVLQMRAEKDPLIKGLGRGTMWDSNKKGTLFYFI